MNSSAEIAVTLHEKAEMASDLRRYEEAQSLAAQSIAADPQFADGFVALGRACIGLQQYEDAEKHFKHALSLNPENEQYLKCVSYALGCLGRDAESLGFAREMARVAPEVSDSHVYMASALHRLRQLDEAKENYQNAVILDPENHDAITGLADVCLDKEEFKEAELHYRAALRIHSDDAGILNDLGVCLERQGKIKDAALAYKSALLTDPTLDVAKQNTKQAVEKYLSIGGGIFFVYIGFKLTFLLARNRNGEPPEWWVLATIVASFIGIVVFGGFALYRRHRKKRDLQMADPQLLEIYNTIRKDQAHR